jgi:N-acetylmuramoyl-L-alanine amidase
MMYKVYFRIIACTMLFGWFLYASPVFSQSLPAKSTVIVDPAHGGADSGVKISDKIHEKDITLTLALLIQKELSKVGHIQVILTRDKDRDVSTQERVNRISTTQPRIMVSLHINAGFYKTAKGFEIYFPGFKTGKSVKDSPSAIISDMKKNKNLPLLEGITIPAVIVEIGFSGNAENRKKLNDEKYRLDIARALSKAIRESL